MQVYALYASDEPLQVRYVGVTTGDLEARLGGHLWSNKLQDRKKRDWINSVLARGAEVKIRQLSWHTTLDELALAEYRWIQFWSCYCDLTNSIMAYRKISPQVEKEIVAQFMRCDFRPAKLRVKPAKQSPVTPDKPKYQQRLLLALR